MNIKALLEKRGLLVRELEDYAKLEAATEDQTKRSKAAVAELEAVKAQIAEAEVVARAIADGQQAVNMPVPLVNDGDGQRGVKPIVTTPGLEVRTIKLQNARAFTAARFGTTAAAEEAAIRTGMEIAAGVFRNPRAAQWCREHSMNIRTDGQNTMVNADGGYLVSTETDGEIVKLLNEYGVARRFCRIQSMASNAFDKRKLKKGLTAAFVNEGGDGSSLSASKMVFDNVKLVAKKAYTLVPYSTEISEDSIASMADEIVMESARAFAALEDDALFNGTGGNDYKGILGILNAVEAGSIKAQTSLTTFATCTDAFLMAALAALPSYARNRAWFAHPEVIEAVFNRLSRTAGGVTRLEMTNSGPISYYAGYPLIPTEVMPHAGTTKTAYAVVGDLGAAVLFGDRRGITLQNLTERYADEDLFAVKATERFDIVVHDRGTSTVGGAVIRCNLG